MLRYNKIISFSCLFKLWILSIVLLILFATFPKDDDSLVNGSCSQVDLTKYIQPSINKPVDATEEFTLNFVADLKNPCWYETFTEYDLEMMRSSPYNQVYDKKDSPQPDRFKKEINRYVDYYSNMLKNNENARLRCIPYFYIIGQPKCASTDFYNALNLHPQIWKGMAKESQWWLWTIQGLVDKNNATDLKLVPVELSDFADLYSNVSINWQHQLRIRCAHPVDDCQQPIISDGSVYTLSAAFEESETGLRRGMVLEKPITAPNYLKWLIPQAKFIVLVREPGERIYSAYKYFRSKYIKFDHKKNVTISPANFHQEITNYLKLFNECVKETPAYICRFKEELPRGQDMLVTDSLYSTYVEEWIRVVGLDNILVFRTEDYKKKRLETLEKTFKFLGVCDPPAAVKMQLTKVTEINPGRINIGPMLPETRQLLNDFFRPYNKKLAQLLNDQKFLWDDYT